MQNYQRHIDRWHTDNRRKRRLVGSLHYRENLEIRVCSTKNMSKTYESNRKIKQLKGFPNAQKKIHFWYRINSEFPKLHRIAALLFNGSMTSSSSLERTFSISSQICRKDRRSLRDFTVEALIQAAFEPNFMCEFTE